MLRVLFRGRGAGTGAGGGPRSGRPDGRLIWGYRDYGCPDFRRAFREVERVESRLGGQVRFAFRHFPTPEIHTHAVAAASAAEALAR